jgi:hypothetical protein
MRPILSASLLLLACASLHVSLSRAERDDTPADVAHLRAQNGECEPYHLFTDSTFSRYWIAAGDSVTLGPISTREEGMELVRAMCRTHSHITES